MSKGKIFKFYWSQVGFHGGSDGKETWVQSLSQEDPLKKEMATHSFILAWKISQTEEPEGLQSTGSQRTGHDWETNTFTVYGEGNGNPLQCSCLGNPMDRGAWWTTVHGVAELDMTEWLSTASQWRHCVVSLWVLIWVNTITKYISGNFGERWTLTGKELTVIGVKMWMWLWLFKNHFVCFRLCWVFVAMQPFL